MLKKVLTIGVLAVFGLTAHAAQVTAEYDTFGNLAGATFGGSGIPTDPSAISYSGGTPAVGGITLGLIAHQRYSNPVLGNNGLGTYTAGAGMNDGLVGQSVGALWNFGWYANLGASTFNDVNVFLYVDQLAGVGTDESLLTPINISDLMKTYQMGGFSLAQNSGNLGFNSLNGAAGGNAGEYSFVLEAFDANGGSLARSAIIVNVGNGNNVPEPGTLALIGVALAGFAFARRRKAA